MLIAAALLWLAPAQAEEIRRQFNIPRGPAARSIAEFARQADVNVLASSSGLDGVITNEVNGLLEIGEALAQLVNRTGLVSHINPNGSIFIATPKIQERTPDANSRLPHETQAGQNRRI